MIAAGTAARAADVAEDFSATVTGGETQISNSVVANGVLTDETADSPWQPTAGVRLGVGMRITGARAVARAGYGFGLVRFFNPPEMPIAGGSNAIYTTSHEASVATDQMLTSRDHLVLGLNGSVYTLAALPISVSAMAPTGVPAASNNTHLLGLGAGETWSYEPGGTRRYLQSLTAGYNRSLDEGTQFPQTLQLVAAGRGEQQKGRAIYSLTAQLADQMRLDTPPPTAMTSAFAGTQVWSAQLLAGLGRQLSATTTIEAQGGVMALYSPALGMLAMGPAAAAALNYRRVPWFGTLAVAHGPALNGYVASATVSDSITARASLPLNAMETLTLSGGAGYSYSRSVTANNGTGGGFYNTSKLYDAVTLSGYASYQFIRAPFAVSLEYSLIDQRGYSNADSFAPSIRRRYLGIAVSGRFSTDRVERARTSVR